VNAGNAPSAIAVAPGGKFAYVTNSTSGPGILAAYSIASGVLSATPIASIATGTYPRSVAIHPSGKFAYVANFNSNSVSAYSIDANGALASIDADGGAAGTQASIATRSNPVSIAIDPSGSHAYVANAASNDVSVYSIDSLTGALTAVPADGVTGHATYVTTGGTNPSSVVVDPNDQYLYVTNRGTSDDITIFSISSNGALNPTSLVPAHVAGDYPVSIAIDPTGANVYVVNNGNDNVSFYTATGSGSLAWVSSLQAGTTPISITMDSTGQYAYVANSASNDISVYSVVGGTLNPINCPGSPSVCNGNNFLAGTDPYSVITSR
jgi:VCBS repeat-containing protein